MKRNTLAIFLMLMLLSITTSSTAQVTPKAHNLSADVSDLSDAKVALFFGSNTEISNACRIALESMFLWMNASVDTINATQIKNGILYDYDILGIPPGNLAEYTVSLGYDGLDAIRDYVRNGGSYVGISRGAHFACRTVDWVDESEYLLCLFNGTGKGPIDGQLGQTMEEINVNNDCSEIDLSGLPDRLTMFQWEGIHFVPDEDTLPFFNVSYWGDTDRPSQIAYQYGSGCVFLSGCHPELEEDSNRDHSSYFDSHSDPETDWPLMLPVSRWLVDTSTWDNASITPTSSTTTSETITNQTTTNPQDMASEMFVILGVSAVIVLVVVVFVIRRK